MFQDDWIMRQTEVFARMIAKLVFHKDLPAYTLSKEDSLTEADLLYLKLKQRLADGNINEAENLLFDGLDTNNWGYLEVALDFYSRLSSMSEEDLEAADFSRAEVEQGLKEAVALFDITLPA